jgi:hypothetical protein
MHYVQCQNTIFPHTNIWIIDFHVSIFLPTMWKSQIIVKY